MGAAVSYERCDALDRSTRSSRGDRKGIRRTAPDKTSAWVKNDSARMVEQRHYEDARVQRERLERRLRFALSPAKPRRQRRTPLRPGIRNRLTPEPSTQGGCVASRRTACAAYRFTHVHTTSFRWVNHTPKNALLSSGKRRICAYSSGAGNQSLARGVLPLADLL